MWSPVKVGLTRAISPGAASSTVTSTTAITSAARPRSRRIREGRAAASRVDASMAVVAKAMDVSPSARSAAVGRLARSRQPRTRVYRADDQVDDEVDQHVPQADEHDGALDDGNVLAGDGGGEIAAQAGPAEDDLRDGRAGQDVAELKAHGGN